MSDHAPMLSARDLEVIYKRGRHVFPAVRGVSLDIAEGETLGLVGESGSGKTTIARAVQGLISPSAGTIELDGVPVTARTWRDRRRLAADVQTVFQDPFGSLNPSRTVGAALEESLIVLESHLSRKEMARRVASELERVGLPAAAAGRYPKEFSGGQRQRIAIARALIARPRLVICDEAVSALDLSIQAQILNLLADLQNERGISYLFITHDLTVVQHVADRIAVLQRGAIADRFDARSFDSTTWSTYTRKLFDAAPIPDPARQREKREQFEKVLREEHLAESPA